jgi:archaellum biogenesis ATPase FlaH
MHEKKTLHNRSELKRDLNVSLADTGCVEGSLVLLCGPKDVGKTFFSKAIYGGSQVERKCLPCLY